MAKRRAKIMRPLWARAAPSPELPKGYARLFPRRDPSKAARIALFVEKNAVWSYNLVTIALGEIAPQLGIMSDRPAWEYLRAGRYIIAKNRQLAERLAARWE